MIKGLIDAFQIYNVGKNLKEVFVDHNTDLKNKLSEVAESVGNAAKALVADGKAALNGLNNVVKTPPAVRV
jgi:hypothetical protein